MIYQGISSLLIHFSELVHEIVHHVLLNLTSTKGFAMGSTKGHEGCSRVKSRGYTPQRLPFPPFTLLVPGTKECFPSCGVRRECCPPGRLNGEYVWF